MRFQLMKNNLQWFQSPRPNSFNFTQTHTHHQPFPDLNHIHPNNLTPTHMPYHTLSPCPPTHPNPKPDTDSPFHNQADLPKNRVINDLVVFSEEDDDEEVQTPLHQQRNKKNQELLTTGKKSHSEKNLLPRKSRPKDKGLRGISLKSLNTVLQMKQGTYKQVANKLLESFEEEDSVRPPNEETNIKRRVYDALNVLISLGLLKKQGRMIVGQQTPQDKKKEKAIEVQMLRRRINLKQFILQEKTRKFQQTKQKYKSVQHVFEENKKQYETVQADQTFIPFPFIGMLTNSYQWKIVQISRQELTMQFKEKVHPFGDMDVINRLQSSFR